MSQARDKRDEAKEMIAAGSDPAMSKAEDKRLAVFKNAQTFELVAREWHARNFDSWTERYAKEILLRLENNAFPFIGVKQISQVNIQDVIHCLHKIEDRKAYDMTRRVMRIIGQILRYAVVTGRADRDFTSDLKGSLKKYRSGHYASITSKQLPDFLKKLNGNNGRLFKQTVQATKLLMLTLVRTNELIQAKKTEFDFEKNLWVIPAERMKMKLEHVVPLSTQVRTILEDLFTSFPKSDYLLPSIINHRKPISDNTILKAIANLGYKGIMTGHGFRSLGMTTIKEELDYRHEVIDRQLAHVPKNKIDKAYDRAQFLDKRIVIMQEWANLIDQYSELLS